MEVILGLSTKKNPALAGFLEEILADLFLVAAPTIS